MCCLNVTAIEKSYKMESNNKMKDGRHEYDVIKGYKIESVKIEKETMKFLRVM